MTCYRGRKVADAEVITLPWRLWLTTRTSCHHVSRAAASTLVLFGSANVLHPSSLPGSLYERRTVSSEQEPAELRADNLSAWHAFYCRSRPPGGTSAPSSALRGPGEGPSRGRRLPRHPFRIENTHRGGRHGEDRQRFPELPAESR